MADINAKRRHTCMIDDDPDYRGPCTCGASSTNSAIDDALEELELE
jgi:hypothetical protein